MVLVINFDYVVVILTIIIKMVHMVNLVKIKFIIIIHFYLYRYINQNIMVNNNNYNTIPMMALNYNNIVTQIICLLNISKPLNLIIFYLSLYRYLSYI